MDPKFPKRVKAYKLNDRVICTKEGNDKMQWARGWVRYIGPIKDAKGTFFGVEFDRLVKSKVDVTKYFPCKPDFGAFFELMEICKITDEKFDEAAFKVFIKQNPGFSDAPIVASKKETVIEFAESQGDFGEESQVNPLEQPKPAQQEQPKPPEPPKPVQQEQPKPPEPVKPAEQEQPKPSENPPPTEPTVIIAPKEPAQAEPQKKNLTINANTKPADPPKTDKQTNVVKQPPKTPTASGKNDSRQPAPKSTTPEPHSIPPKNPFAEQQKTEAKPQADPKPPVNDHTSNTKTAPVSATPTPFSQSEDNFIEIQKLNLQINNLQNEKHVLKKHLEKAENELFAISHKYEGLRKMSDSSNTDLGKLNEANAELKASVHRLEEERTELKAQLERCKDYDSFKTKFEKMSIDSISLKEELDIYKRKAQSFEAELKATKEELEILQLEAEIEARSESEPLTLEEYKNRYKLLKNAFQKLDEDILLQQGEYEKKMEQLNSEIIRLRGDARDPIGSEQVKKMLSDKDRQIKDLHELVNDFAKTRETTEGLFADFRAKQEELERVKENMNKAMELVKNYQEEIAEFEAITKELEENLGLADLRVCERENAIKALTDEKTELEQKIGKFKQKLAEIEEHKNMLEVRQQAGPGEPAMLDSATLSTYYQDYNRMAAQKQGLLRERMTLKMRGRADGLESMKWLIYKDAIPQKVLQELQTRQFDLYKSVRLASDRIDIIVENLLVHYVFNDTLQVESPNLVSMSRDLFKALAHFQPYLNHLRALILKSENAEQLAEVEKSPLCLKLLNAFPKLNDVFDLIKDNELSTQFAFSEVSEGALQLKQETAEHDLHSTPENHQKLAILAIMSALVDKFFDPATDPPTKSAIQDAVQRLLLLNESVLESSLEERAMAKLQHYSSCAAEALKEFRAWLDTFCREFEKTVRSPEQVRQGLAAGVWKGPIESVRRELEGHEALKEGLQAAEGNVQRLEGEVAKKAKEVEVLNKAKIVAEGKILKLQGIANNISTLEYEIAELKKVEARQAEELDELTAKNKEMQGQIAEKDKVLERRNTNVNRLRDGVGKIIKSNLLFRKPSDISGSYIGRERFEINSLSAVLSNALYQLNLLRTQELKQKLETLNDKAPVFAQFFRAMANNAYDGPSVSKAIDSLGKFQGQIKAEVSKLKVVDLSNKEKADESIKNYSQSKNKIRDLLLRSNQTLLKGLGATQEGRLAYEVDITKEMKGEALDRTSAVYGKLSFVPVSAKEPRTGVLKGNTLHVDVSLA